MIKTIKKLSLFIASFMLLANAYAQNSAPAAQAQAVSASRELADFIVAIVQYEPITDSQLRVHMLSIKRGRDAGELPPDNQLRKIALSQLITQSALAQRAQEMGIRVDPKMVQQALVSIAQNNNMSLGEMEKALLKDGIPLSSLRNEIESQMAISQLRERTLDPTITVSNAELNQYMKSLSEKGDAKQELVSLAQILVAVPENATPAQIQKLQTRAQKIYASAKEASNTEFFTLADQNSDDPTVTRSHGFLGARPLSQFPDLFIKAITGLRPGDVTAPIRSGAGFHIVRVLDREGADMIDTVVIQTHARHILLTPTDAQAQEQAINTLRADKRKIETGEVSFETLAQEQSKDTSAKQGGDLGWVVPGMFVPEFERAMDQLEPGQISEPVVTRFGVHLIQVLERRESQLTEQQRREIARETIHQSKVEQAYAQWAKDIESGAYIEIRVP